MTNNNIYLEIANRLIHYSPFSISKIRQENFTLKRKYSIFELVVRADYTLNQQDNDVFKSIVKLLQLAYKEGKIVKQTLTVDKESYTVAGAKFYLADLVNLSKSKWSFVVESINRLSSMRITYKNKKKTTHTTPFPKLVIDNNIVTVFFDYELFEKCITKETALTQNLSYFTKLNSNLSKALYDFITANSSLTRFKEDTLIERLDLLGLQPYEARSKLKKAFQELQNNYIIKGYWHEAGYFTYQKYEATTVSHAPVICFHAKTVIL